MDKGKSSATELPSLGTLLANSVDLYKQGWRLYVWLITLPLLASILVVAVVGAVIAAVLAVSGGDLTPDRIPWLIPPALVGIIGLVIVNAIGKIALIKAISLDGVSTIRELLTFSRPLVWKFFWLQILTGLAVFVGFLLLVIPGIVFSTWFLFSTIILVIEGTDGTAAMKRSKFYARGKFWGLFGRMLALMIIVIIFSVLGSSVENQTFNLLVQLFSTLVIAPIASIYTFKLYQGAKAAS